MITYRPLGDETGVAPVCPTQAAIKDYPQFRWGATHDSLRNSAVRALSAPRSTSWTYRDRAGTRALDGVECHC